jgi:hypothetical protein
MIFRSNIAILSGLPRSGEYRVFFWFNCESLLTVVRNCADACHEKRSLR